MTGAVAIGSSADRALPDRRVWMAGVPVDILGESEIIALFESSVAQKDRIVLANVNLHGLFSALTSHEMHDLLTGPDSIVHIDGMPIVWMARAMGAHIPPKSRNGHIDLIPKLLVKCAAAGLPVMFVGSPPEHGPANEKALRAMAPDLKLTVFDGYFDMNDWTPQSRQSEIIATINEVKPALLLVGMGMPRQEQWIASIRNRIETPVIMPVGGFVDYFAGRTRTAPRFLGPLGLEWLFRLVHDPRRLAFRYLVEPLLLLAHLLRATLKGAQWGATPRQPK